MIKEEIGLIVMHPKAWVDLLRNVYDTKFVSGISMKHRPIPWLGTLYFFDNIPVFIDRTTPEDKIFLYSKSDLGQLIHLATHGEAKTLKELLEGF
jgi:hypothetical protein